MSHKNQDKPKEISFLHLFLTDIANMISQISSAMLMGFGFIAGVMLFFTLSEMITAQLHKHKGTSAHVEIQVDE